MSLLDLIAAILTLTAMLAWLNARFMRLPATIGVMVLAIALSLALVVFDKAGFGFAQHAERLIARIDFRATLMNGMLSFLLFAGALQVKSGLLRANYGAVAILATVGVALSTVIVALLTWGFALLIGLDLPLRFALLFGALIAPTDPVAVLAILRKAHVDETLELKITAESLFNDGVGVVLFVLILAFAGGRGDASVAGGLLLFAREALGGAVFGAAVGGVAYYLLRSVDNYQTEVLVTLALVTGGYALAHALGLSGPIAMVVAGLLIGNAGRAYAMSDNTRRHVDLFWEMVDEILNAVLFVLIGLEVLLVSLKPLWLLAGGGAIVIVLLARLASVSLPALLIGRIRVFRNNTIPVLTWGALRGGIAVALALSIPHGDKRDIVLTMTYVVVVFSILVQGLTIGPLVKRFARRQRNQVAEATDDERLARTTLDSPAAPTDGS